MLVAKVFWRVFVITHILMSMKNLMSSPSVLACAAFVVGVICQFIDPYCSDRALIASSDAAMAHGSFCDLLYYMQVRLGVLVFMLMFVVVICALITIVCSAVISKGHTIRGKKTAAWFAGATAMLLLWRSFIGTFFPALFSR